MYPTEGFSASMTPPGRASYFAGIMLVEFNLMYYA
jgi:hypothetical protein